MTKKQNNNNNNNNNLKGTLKPILPMKYNQQF
jgi:hypothetical protein